MPNQEFNNHIDNAKGVGQNRFIKFGLNLLIWLKYFLTASVTLHILFSVFTLQGGSLRQMIFWPWLYLNVGIGIFIIIISIFISIFKPDLKQDYKNESDSDIKNQDNKEPLAPAPPMGYEFQGRDYKLRKRIFWIYVFYAITGALFMFISQYLNEPMASFFQMFGFFTLFPSGFMIYHMWLEPRRAQKSPLWFYISILVVITLIIVLPFLIMAIPQ